VACVARYREEPLVGTLLAAVRRCNTYNADDFVPVLVGSTQVGWLNAEAMKALAPQLAIGTACELVDVSTGQINAAPLAATAVRIAPHAASPATRTEYVSEIVADLVEDGLIPRRKLRHELQDVHPLASGFVPLQMATPCLQMERAAMIYFGVPSYGVHVNGWMRDPENLHDPTPWGMWVAKRSCVHGPLEVMGAIASPFALD